MNVFEFTDDSDDDFGFLSGVAGRNKSGDHKKEVDQLHEDTKSLLRSLGKGKEPKEEAKVVVSQVDDEPLSQQSIGSSALGDISQSLSASQLSVTIDDTKPVVASVSSKTTPKPRTPAGSKQTSSSMPLVMSTSLPKASTLLVQLEDSKLDLSGDVGAIGRFHSQDDGGVVLDIKGHQYIGEIVPCGTFMVVGIGATEAKVENMVTDFCQITQKLSVIESISGVVLAGKTGEVSSSDEGAESPTRTGKPAATLKGRKRKKASSDDDDDSDADSDASEAKAPASTAKKPRKTPTKTKTPAKKATKSPAKPPAKTPAKKTPAKTKAASASKAKSAKKAPPKK